MKVVEKFISINGEGQRAGELAVFIRFKGCNLKCSYCDTMWANEEGCIYEEESPGKIYEYIKNTGVKNVTLTGGEPLLQKEIKELVGILLRDTELRVEIETNGAVELNRVFEGNKRPEGNLSFTMDYKLLTSGCECRMLKENFELLNKEDTVKFVAGSREDLLHALEVINKFSLIKRCHVYFSPVFGSIEPVEIVQFMIDNNINEARLQIQMHKVIWDPNERGV